MPGGAALTGPATISIVGRVSEASPGFFVKKIRRKIAGKKQKFPINAVT